LLHEYDPPSPQEQALKLKEKGNIAFKELDYAQASLFYSQAVEILENLVTETLATTSMTDDQKKLHDECREVLCVIYSNRAACALKLGDHQLALTDANACLVLDPENIKANFRKGLALHALGRYREACPVLGLALQREPKNQQIKSALLFAERKAALPNSK
jgi:tetratricopeptide (TPR) repeat protein